MEVVRDRIEFSTDGESTIHTENDPSSWIPKYHVYSLLPSKGEAAMFKERTDPPRDHKITSLENLLDDGYLNIVSTFRACYRGNTNLALSGGFQLLDQAFTMVKGRIASFFFP